MPERNLTPKHMAEHFTEARPCAVEGCPEAQTVWFLVGNQSFCLSGYCENVEEAEWMRLQLGSALAKLCEIV